MKFIHYLNWRTQELAFEATTKPYSAIRQGKTSALMFAHSVYVFVLTAICLPFVPVTFALVLCGLRRAPIAKLDALNATASADHGKKAKKLGYGKVAAANGGGSHVSN